MDKKGHIHYVITLVQPDRRDEVDHRDYLGNIICESQSVEAYKKTLEKMK
ncbi:hypothetical protein [Thermoactinomyces mirandus]|nr:hypothetical protein [Thermoactinomyces mirandus]